jgi:hypothetical protein
MNEYNDKHQRIGYWEKYFSNGNPWYKGHYINGKEDGYWEWYNIDSKLVLKEFHLWIKDIIKETKLMVNAMVIGKNIG